MTQLKSDQSIVRQSRGFRTLIQGINTDETDDDDDDDVVDLIQVVRHLLRLTCGVETCE